MSEPEEIAMAKSKGKKTAKTPDQAAVAPAVGTGIVARPPFWAGREAEKMSKKDYEAELARLEIELVKLQGWIREKGLKVAVIFEGRDSAGKGGVIKRITYRMSPRVARVVALQTPTEKEKSQWYFQRYVPHLPSAGEMVLFDRSWYNRAGVERVMGFCTDDQYNEFMATVNGFEAALVGSGTILIKYWLDIADETQEERFDERIIDPRKRWKLSPMDLFARSKWVDYSRARDVMLAHTDTEHAPWWIVDGNIKRHARLNTITHLLSQVPYKDLTPKKLKLPRRQKAGGYQPPDYSKAHFVPTVWPKDD
jgi:polyphosphate kinase 2